MNMEELQAEFARLVKIIERLRGPDGCPWDQRQTHYSLAPNILEEAYEVVETLENRDLNSLKEELGDLLLQVVFEAQIGRENSSFDLREVLELINKKMIRRHPHVFAETRVDSVEEVLANWEEIKEQETEGESSDSLMDDYSQAQPALTQAYEIQEKAAEVGFDWDQVEDVMAKIEEEAEELKQALAGEDPGHIQEELGDLLFATVNLARFYSISPEVALVGTILKFKKRFRFIEKEVSRKGQQLTQLSLAELDEFWEQAKEVSTKEG